MLVTGKQFLLLTRHSPIFAGRNPYPFLFMNFIKIKTKLTCINLHVIRFNHCQIIHAEECVLAIQNLHGLVESLVYRSLKKSPSLAILKWTIYDAIMYFIAENSTHAGGISVYTCTLIYFCICFYDINIGTLHIEWYFLFFILLATRFLVPCKREYNWNIVPFNNNQSIAIL